MTQPPAKATVLIDQALAAMRQAMAATQSVRAAVARLDRINPTPLPLPKTPRQSRVKQPVNAPLNGETLTAWRAARRSGHPSRIDCDPELQALILAELPGKTYGQVAALIASRFPPDRQVKRSALQAWWKRHCATGADQTTPQI